ncbi:LysE family translocator [Paracoccus sp. P2]|uniref:LysE family translocator n=1 Tax=Paracoccus TaxID=265 RepID=UPI0004BA2296|nr:LysE family transporter [Paracoccus pantotrophus]RDD94345.1 LysE family translocator [Paracoccus pantotrophus]WGR66261.1 LysE family translocator [Paracoccus pantotrophus]
MAEPQALLAMAGFALAASATPGPVNIIGAMIGARFGPRRALGFVSGATAGFLMLLLGFGAGLLAGTGWILALSRPMTLAGAAYLLWLAWRLLRGDGRVEWSGPAATAAPGFWSGVLVQGLNPKAWLAVLSSLSTFVMPLADPATGLAAFAALFGAICWLSLAAWAWGGARVGQGRLRAFNRGMALVLALSVAWMLARAFS